ncbi:hypothetical protein [Rubritalea tangerina]|uniref:hypothetical protein n=1 Tax=Rubritalea tangerina TaxID=430798 RepID=UPI00361F6D56
MVFASHSRLCVVVSARLLQCDQGRQRFSTKTCQLRNYAGRTRRCTQPLTAVDFRSLLPILHP